MRSIAKLSLTAAIFLTSCSSPSSPGESVSTFVVASTTSTQDSGLLDELVPSFEQDHPDLRAKVVAVGSGEAIDLGRQGDADVLLVHSPKQEEQFMTEGFGEFRKRVMKNNFVIIGPSTDRARVAGASDAAAAVQKIAAAQDTFLSRGDESGTHQRELDLWEKAGVDHSGDWYVESGQGMAETLSISDQRSAYTLTDTATFKVMEGRISLKVLFEGDPALVNPYSVIPVKEARNREAALAFASWMTGSRGQQVIRKFGVKQYGSSLFEPDAASE